MVEGEPQDAAVDVVEQRPLGVELGVVHHAHLHPGHRVGVDDPRGQLGAVLRGEHRERLAGRRRRLRGRPEAGLRGEPGHRLGAEELRQREVQPALARQADHLDAEDRVAPEGEEVVVHPDPVDAQDLRPHRGQDLLGRGARRHVLLGEIGAPRVGVGKRPPVHLAVGGHRERLDGDELGRDHVLGKAGAEVLAQALGCHPFGARRHQPGDQPRAGGARAGHDDRFPHPVVGGQRGLDLAELDAMAAHLDLVVEAPEVLEVAVGSPPGEVAGAVEAATRPRPEGIGDEAAGGERRPAEIAAGDPRAADAQLPHHADRHRPQRGVHQVHLQIRDAPADDAARRRVEVGAADRPVGDVDRGLGDAIHVDQGRPAVAVAGEPGAQALELEGLATEDHPPQGERAAVTAFGGLPVGGDELAEGRRRLVEHADPLAAQQLEEGRGGAADVVVDHHQAAAVGERAPDLPHREIEGEGVEQGPHVVGAECEPRPGGVEQACQVAVGDLHPLGAAGRAGGVDHVGEVVHRRLTAAGGRPRPAWRPVHRLELEDVDAELGDEAPVFLVGDDQGRTAVFEHQPQPLLRVRRVEREVGAAGLEHADQRGDGGRVAAGAQADEGPRADAAPGQLAGDGLGAPVELAVARRAPAADQGDGLGPAAGGAFEGPVERLRRRRDAAARRPLDDRLVALGGAEQRQLSEAQVRIAGDGAQKADELVRQPPDRRPVEQVRAVLDRPFDPGGGIGHPDAEVELRRRRVEGERPLADSGQLAPRRPRRVAVERQGDLEQRRVGQVALRLQLVDDPLEGHVLVVVGLQGGPPRAAEELAERRLAGQVHPQHQGVGEEADEGLGLDPVPVGDGTAEGDVGLPRPAAEERRQGGGQDHEQARLLGPGQRPEALGRRPVQRQPEGGAAGRPQRRPRPVGRQLQPRRGRRAGRASRRAAPPGARRRARAARLRSPRTGSAARPAVTAAPRRRRRRAPPLRGPGPRSTSRPTRCGGG